MNLIEFLISDQKNLKYFKNIKAQTVMCSIRTKFPDYLNPFEDFVYVDPVYRRSTNKFVVKPKDKKIRKLVRKEKEISDNKCVVPYKRNADSSTINVRKSVFKKIEPLSVSSFGYRRVMSHFIRKSGNFPLVPYVAPPFSINNNIFVNRQLKIERIKEIQSVRAPFRVCLDPFVEVDPYDSELYPLYDKEELRYQKLCQEIQNHIQKEKKELNEVEDVVPSYIY